MDSTDHRFDTRRARSRGRRAAGITCSNRGARRAHGTECHCATVDTGADTHHPRTDPDHRVHTAPATTSAAVHGIEVPLSALDTEYWLETRVRAMGSTAHILIGDAPDGLLEWARRELEALEQCWTRFRPTSELSELHRHADQWYPVSSRLLLAFTSAADLHRATRGRFDPTIRDALERAGYDRSFELIDSGTSGHDFAAAPVPGFAQVGIDFQHSRVRLPRAVRIDLGGIGKGLAADLVARGLIERGARHALVSVGGDMRACGEPPPSGAWDIPVEHPLHSESVAFVHPLAHSALVASTCRIRAWERNGRQHHHLIDPATGDSAHAGVAAVVASARNAWWAEGIAKAIVIAGQPDGVALARDTGVRAWLFLDDGTMLEAGP
jgi:thiamine biosynthesis lipoprotein